MRYQLTGTPFDGPVAGLRVGRVNGEFKAFFGLQKSAKSQIFWLWLVLESGITMVEAEQRSFEDVIVDAMAWAHQMMVPVDCSAKN